MNNKTYLFLSSKILSSPILSFIKLLNFFYQNCLILLQNWLYINPIHETSFKLRGGGRGRRRGKGPSTSFPPVTSTNVGFRPKNFLTFSFKACTTLISNFKAIPNANLKLLNVNQDHPAKNWYFCSNLYKIEVIIASLIDMLKLPLHYNLSHVVKFLVRLWT